MYVVEFRTGGALRWHKIYTSAEVIERRERWALRRWLRGEIAAFKIYREG